MRTIETVLYKFDELSETAKQTAISNLCDINTDCDWWNCTYDDAKEIGLKISGFDIDRSYANGDMNVTMLESIDLIKKNHGAMCEAYKLAVSYSERYDEMFAKFEDSERKGHISEEFEYEFDNELDELESSFKNDLCDEYLTILRDEYEYLTSEESIIEAILINGYEFEENGDLA